jgi:hypothetical protein
MQLIKDEADDVDAHCARIPEVWPVRMRRLLGYGAKT